MKTLATLLLAIPLSARAADPAAIGAIPQYDCNEMLSAPPASIFAMARALVEPTARIGADYLETLKSRLGNVLGSESGVSIFSGFRHEPPGDRQTRLFSPDTPDEAMDIAGVYLGEFWYDVGADGLVNFSVRLLIETSFEGAADLTFTERKRRALDHPPIAKPLRYRLQFERPVHSSVEQNAVRVLLTESGPALQAHFEVQMIEIWRKTMLSLNERCRTAGHECVSGDLYRQDDVFEISLSPTPGIEAMALVLHRWVGDQRRGSIFVP